jgi:ferredoxin-NADP reductase
MGSPYELRLRVEEVRREADDVISIVLASPVGAELPEWSPGAHVEMRLPSGLVRQYSLCGDPAHRGEYMIAVLREPNGRGGSVEIHELPLVGRIFDARLPRNTFPLLPNESYLFIAGGIGITPILAMIRRLAHTAPWSLHYGGRALRHMAFTEYLLSHGQQRVLITPQDEHGLLDVAKIVAGADRGAAIYCCGPSGLLEATKLARDRLAPENPLYIERFTAGGSSGKDKSGGQPSEERAFEIELRRSGVTTTVPPDRSTLDVIREFVPEMPFSCEEGYCASCEIAVLEGIPDHRDDILTEEERTQNRTMFPCVSRACSDRLVLDC